MAEDIKEKVLKEIREEDVCDLLARLVRLNSVVGTASQCPQFIESKLRDIGMKVETYNLEDFRTGRVIIGYLEGSRNRPCLMFEGHWDTDSVDTSKWTCDPFGGTVSDGYIYGRGVVDSKGSLAAMISAIEAIKKSNTKLNGSLILLSIGDGESAFRGGDLVVDAGIADHVDWVISGEATNLETIDVAHSGLLVCKLDVIGKASHPAQPQHGISAIYKMSKILSGIERNEVKFRYEPYKYFPDFPRIHVNAIRTQPKGFEVPDECNIILQIFSVAGMTPQSILEDITHYLEELKKEDKELNYRLKVLPRGWYFWRPPGEVSPKEHVVTALQKATKSITGIELDLAGFYGVYDVGAVLMTRASRGELFGKPSSVTFGPGEFRMAHAANENLEIKQLVDCTKIYALAALELLGTDRES